MAKAHSTEPLSGQVITYLSDYCKTEISRIKYHPQLHSFDLYFNIESLVGTVLKSAFCIHVQRPAMNVELYDIIIELVNILHDEVENPDERAVYINLTNKRTLSKTVREYIANNNIGTLAGIFKQFPDLTFATSLYANIKQRASTVVSLGYRKFTGNTSNCDLLCKMIEWLKEYSIFEVTFDVNRPTKMSRVAFIAPDGFKDFFPFKYLAELVKLSEPTDFKPKTIDTNAMAFDL